MRFVRGAERGAGHTTCALERSPSLRQQAKVVRISSTTGNAHLRIDGEAEISPLEWLLHYAATPVAKKHKRHAEGLCVALRRSANLSSKVKALRGARAGEQPRLNWGEAGRVRKGLVRGRTPDTPSAAHLTQVRVPHLFVRSRPSKDGKGKFDLSGGKG